MNQKSVQEYIARQQQRYGDAIRKEKSRILDDVVAVTGYHRKSVIRQLSGRSRPARGGQVGRPVEYGSKVSEAAALVHEAAGGIGARLLRSSSATQCRHDVLPVWKAFFVSKPVSATEF